MADNQTAASATAGEDLTSTTDVSEEVSTPSTTRALPPLPELSDPTSRFDPLAGPDDQSEDGTNDDTEYTSGNDDTPAADDADTAGADEESTAAADDSATAELDAETQDLANEIAQARKDGDKPRTVKRLQKLLDQRNAALAAEKQSRTRISELESQLADAATKQQDQPVPVKLEGDPLATITTLEQLDAERSNWDAWRRWSITHPYGGTPPGHEEEITAERAAEIRLQAEDMLKAADAREAFLHKFQSARAEIRKTHPRLFTAGTEENKAHGVWQKRLLSFRSDAEQDSIIAKLIKIERQEAEERAGIARYPRVEVPKATASTATAAAATKSAAPPPRPKPAASAPAVPPVRPGNNNGSANRFKQAIDSNKPFDPLEVALAR